MESKSGVKRILLFRHPEALKNLHDKHGGSGESLTPNGLRASTNIAEYLNQYLNYRTLLIGHNVLQVTETIDVIEDINSTFRVLIDNRLRGINLGILSGLSRKQAMIKFPKYAQKLEDWRKGNLKINELNIPEAEKINKFKDRVESAFFEILKKRYSIFIFILTRSTLIMIHNLLTLKTDFDFSKYKVYDFKNSSLTEWSGKLNQQYILLSFNQTSYLNEYRILDR